MTPITPFCVAASDEEIFEFKWQLNNRLNGGLYTDSNQYDYYGVNENGKVDIWHTKPSNIPLLTARQGIARLKGEEHNDVLQPQYPYEIGKEYEFWTSIPSDNWEKRIYAGQNPVKCAMMFMAADDIGIVRTYVKIRPIKPSVRELVVDLILHNHLTPEQVADRIIEIVKEK